MDEKEKIVEKEVQLVEKRDYTEELLEIVKSKDSQKVKREKLSEYHDNDIAEIIPLLTEEERKTLYKILGNEAVSDVFAYLDDVEDYLAELDNEKVADIIESMDVDDAIDVLEELTEEQRNELIPLIEPETQKEINLITSYEDDEIGSRMTTNYITIKKSFTIKEAMSSVIEQAAENDNITTIYTVDENDCFYGAIELRDLVVARNTTPLESIIITNYPYLYDNEKVADCIESLKDYSEDSIPVLNSEQKIMGVITASDIVEAVDEEMSDDYAKLAGLTSEEDLDEPIFKSIKKRIPWLITLLVLGVIVASVIQAFQDLIPSSLLILYTFQSLILGMSGNSGTQSLAVTIRVISNETLSIKERYKFVFKELRVGTCNGLLIGTVAFVLIGLYLQICEASFLASIGISGFIISLCIGASLFIAMLIASLVGTLTPLLFKRIGIDPAVASGPLITTVNDFVAVCVYYGVSLLLLVPLL
ncbi:MAG: magnesium transporter [Clostridia bacterium]|nr:magnesium transporter [Clostridia bacterium]